MKEDQKLVFAEQIEMINNCICPYCRKQVNIYALETDAERLEYARTGMCHDCFGTLQEKFKATAQAIIDRIGADELKRKIEEDVKRKAEAIKMRKTN